MVFLVGVISDLKKKPEPGKKPAASLQPEITEEEVKRATNEPEFAVIDMDNKLIKGEDGDEWYPLQLHRRSTKEMIEEVKENARFVLINIQNRTYYNPTDNNWYPFAYGTTEAKEEGEAEEKPEETKPAA